MTWKILLLLVCIVFGAVGADKEMCQPALSHLVKHGVAAHDLIKVLPSANGSAVCGGGPCCVPGLTKAMTGRGRHLLHIALQQSLSQMSEKVTSARDNFRVAAEEALRSSEYRTLKLLKASFPRLVGHAKAPLKKLFIDFHSSLSSIEDEDLIDRALNAFWNDMFPVVFHTIVHTRLPPFSPAYIDCLRESRSKIRPWKDVPKPIGQSLVRGLEAVRLMIHSLSVGAEAVLLASEYEIPEECGEPAAKLYFCSACHGALIPPCSGLCLNVARGCLAPMAEVDTHWSMLALTTSKLEASIRTSEIALLLKEFPEKLSDAIMVVMESGTKLQKVVRHKCGQYTHEPSDEYRQRTEEGRHFTAEPAMIEDDPKVIEKKLEDRAKEASRVMETSEQFWATLADGVCMSVAPQDTNCWNGLRIAEYSRPTVGLGATAQKYNAEVRVSKYDTRMFALPMRLRSVKTLVTKRLTWIPDAMNFKRSDDEVEGSGADVFHIQNNHPDDEGDDDSYEGSGSDYGSGDGYSRSGAISPLDTPFSADCYECSGARCQQSCFITMVILLIILSVFVRRDL